MFIQHLEHYFAADLKLLGAFDQLPCDIHVYLKKNKRLICICPSGAKGVQEITDRYLSKGIQEFWILKKNRASFEKAISLEPCSDWSLWNQAKNLETDPFVFPMFEKMFTCQDWSEQMKFFASLDQMSASFFKQDPELLDFLSNLTQYAMTAPGTETIPQFKRIAWTGLLFAALFKADEEVLKYFFCQGLGLHLENLLGSKDPLKKREFLNSNFSHSFINMSEIFLKEHNFDLENILYGIKKMDELAQNSSGQKISYAHAIQEGKQQQMSFFNDFDAFLSKLKIKNQEPSRSFTLQDFINSTSRED